MLEFVEGETLARSLARGAMPIEEASTSALQIAEALEAAHENGIVHRDLKPGNVMVTRRGPGEGARLRAREDGMNRATIGRTRTRRPSNALHRTSACVLGTAAYMSPEQARGAAVDRRTDIWSFGCVLYEMPTGRQPFPRARPSRTTDARVLRARSGLGALPDRDTGARCATLVERCLRKDPRHRLRDIGDALLELEALPDETAATDESGGARQRRREYVWAAVALLALATAVIAVAARHTPAPDTRAVAFTVQASQGGVLDVGQPLSPDGRKLAFVAASSGGATLIWVRPIDSPTPRALEGTDGASNVFWSPDSQELGFFAGGRLKRIPAAGGAAQVICSIPGVEGASWGSRGVILIGTRGTLLQVSAAGGEPVPATALNAAAGDQFHERPDFLPDGRHFLFVVLSGGLNHFQAFVGDLDSNERLELPGIRSGARFAATGHVLFTRNNALMAQRFDVARLTLSGEPFQIAERAAGGNTTPFSASTNGSVAYLAQPDTQTEVQWFNRAGTPLGVAGPRGRYFNQELSPDDARIALDLLTEGNVDIWTLDIATSVRSRVTTHEAAEFAPTWSPDGRSIGFTSYRSGVGNLYRREVDVVAASDTLVQQSATEQRLSDWSRDDRYLIYEQDGQTAGEVNIWAVSLGGRPETIRVTNTPFINHNPRLSPDARWIAYESNEAGQFEVYVQSFPRDGARQQVSAGGGLTPRWRPDGTELYYLTGEGVVMARSVTVVGDTLRLGLPSRLFGANVAFTGVGRVLNVSSDGRFLLNVVPADRAPSSLVVLHNWVHSGSAPAP